MSILPVTTLPGALNHYWRGPGWLIGDAAQRADWMVGVIADALYRAGASLRWREVVIGWLALDLRVQLRGDEPYCLFVPYHPRPAGVRWTPEIEAAFEPPAGLAALPVNAPMVVEHLHAVGDALAARWSEPAGWTCYDWLPDGGATSPRQVDLATLREWEASGIAPTAEHAEAIRHYRPLTPDDERALRLTPDPGWVDRTVAQMLAEVERLATETRWSVERYLAELRAGADGTGPVPFIAVRQMMIGPGGALVSAPSLRVSAVG